MEDAQAERAAKNEALFRDVNEKIKGLTEAQASDWASFFCECRDPDCTRTIDMTLAEYETVRARGDRFAMIAGHEDPAIERVVDRNERFLVAEKIGPSADVARDLDPRS
jgi:hypothetical protein